MTALLSLLDFVVEVGLDAVELVLQGSVPAQEGLPFLGLLVSHAFDVIKLGCKLDLDLLEHALVAKDLLQPGGDYKTTPIRCLFWEITIVSFNTYQVLINELQLNI
jgi:hypothetical protein